MFHQSILFPHGESTIKFSGTGFQHLGQLQQRGNFLVDSTIQNFVHDSSVIQSVVAHGLAVPGVIEELRTASLKLHSEQIGSLASSLSVLTLPAYSAGQITTFSNVSIAQGVEFIWWGDGTNYIDNKGIVFTNHTPSEPGVEYVVASSGGFSIVPVTGYMMSATRAMFFQEVATLTQHISHERRRLHWNSEYRIGAIIKMVGGVYFWCRPSVAAKKHLGDFQLFLASAVYRLPVMTQDCDLQQDLRENNVEITILDRRVYEQ